MSAAATPLTPQNHGPVVTIFAVVLACFSASAALTRVHVAFRRRIAVQRDDALYFLAMVSRVHLLLDCFR